MSHSTDQRDGSRRLDEGCPMTEDEKLRFILIVSAIVAALAVHRFLDTSHALAHPTGVRFFAPSGGPGSVGTDCAHGGWLWPSLPLRPLHARPLPRVAPIRGQPAASASCASSRPVHV